MQHFDRGVSVVHGTRRYHTHKTNSGRERAEWHPLLTKELAAHPARAEYEACGAPSSDRPLSNREADVDEARDEKGGNERAIQQRRVI